MSRLEEIHDEDAKLLAKIKVLEDERKKLKLEEFGIKVNENKEWLEHLHENKDFVLSLFNHSRTSCSDENVCNGMYEGSYRCPKCALIEILNGEHGYNYEPVFSVNIISVEDS